MASYPRSRMGLILWALCPAMTSVEAAPPSPVTTRTDPAGVLLNQWYAEGKAAGHGGDFYDNRDGGHSNFDLSQYPQLKPLPYSAESREAKENFGMAREVRSETVLGNASLSGSAVAGASIPRLYYSTREGLGFLSSQFLGNQLYIYPEHQDHDPGGEGQSGWGDLYPTNSPYLIISQGSSGSDQPFLHAFAMTMASFTPEIKKELKEQGVLFPVIQAIFRSSLKPLKAPGDYLTGLAHPSVFPADWIDEEKMMRLAQSMTRETLPPAFRLEVIGESPPPRRGIDFFEGAGRDSESLTDQGMVIARVFRGMARERELTVRVARSQDSMGRPLNFEWRLLRGDPGLVRIEPSPTNEEAKITVSYQAEARPIPGMPEITSRRIDIGVFAGNGVSFSAPSFITFYFLPNERRTYDPKSGRILEVDYGFERAFVDVTLTSEKRWRDVYQYNRETGAPAGWRREEPKLPAAEFDPEGRKRGVRGPMSVLYLSDPATHVLSQLSGE